MSRFDRYSPRTTPHMAGFDEKLGQRPGASAPNTLSATTFPGRIREDQATAFPGDRTWDMIDGVTWTISGGEIVDGSLSGQLQTYIYGPFGDTCYHVDAPSGDNATSSSFTQNLGNESGSGTFTLEWWYAQGSASDDGGLSVELNQSQGGNHAVNLAIAPGAWQITLDIQNEAFVETLNTGALTIPSVPYQTWLHGAVVMEGTTWRLYHDGKLLSNGTGVTCGITDNIRIGPSGSDGSFCGGVKLSSVAQYTGNEYTIPTAGWTID